MNNKQQAPDGEGRKKQPLWKKVLMVLLLILLLLLLIKCSGGTRRGSGNVMFGVIDVPKSDGPGCEKRDLQAEANAIVDENMFRVFISTHMTVDKDGNFEPLIQNTAANRYPCWVEIQGDDGSVIYKSDIVKPGYKIERDTLSDVLIRGKHDCKAYFHVMESSGKDAREINSVCVDVVMVQYM